MTLLPRATSRLAHETCRGDKSVPGSPLKRCYACRKAERDTKETIHNGLLLLRVRYGLPYCELPDSSPADLGRFLSFLLLQGKERASVAFPRRQRVGENGLCNLQRLSKRHRWELAHGCASIKRNLPASCPFHTPSPRKAWETYAVSKPPPTSFEYLQHVRRVCTRLFPAGWDKHYGSFVGNHLPNRSARACKGLAPALWKGRRDEFITRCMNEGEVPRYFMTRYKEVPTAGKKRPLLIYDENVELLAPLHKLLYAKLREQDWLLCGPPTDERMTSVCVNAVQTSVDLVAATDGLAHDVSDVMLDTLFFTSVKIPRSIRRLAYASFRPLFRDGEGWVRQVRHGQMMGAYLSFPLLCLHSYCAATWASRFDGKARILVNGDDCVISASRAVTVQDYPSGYRLNNDKTIRAENVVEVNSTAFLRAGGKWRVVRHVRRVGSTTNYAGMMHMAEAVRVSPAFVDAFQRARIGRRWGFLPSQLGHKTYPSFKRERGFQSRLENVRVFSALPVPQLYRDERLVQKQGVCSAIEAEALRSFLWKESREGRKRDVFDPSCGQVRRTYKYAPRAYRYPLSFVGWRGPVSCLHGVKRPDTYFVPAEFVSEEEERGLVLAEEFASLFKALYPEGIVREYTSE